METECEYLILEFDKNGNDCSNNDGASTESEAIEKLKRICASSNKIVRGCVIEFDGDVECAYVASPDSMADIRDYKEILRNAIFGDDIPHATEDQADNCIQCALNNLNDGGWWNKEFLISDEPVADPQNWPIVFSEQTVRDALFKIFMEEMQ